MNKAYSTKALPPGTVLREWRLEEVLGVGGFGIVYKGRGIYFNELVAIKEYFPSSISERDEEATVVPIDSNAEEVHALGLKKFVEEAKLLWNLSTPSRHPNIVSVRSLFEIHGTAYMVMDFEDGMSLSRLLKQGQRWNERSLIALVKPIAEGLDRAHRVGVLHRDIKPPNILINDNGRPVLIDFGSARFEAAEATSTKVTFHTPPYAAIEQYVKTYEQGPWTDIYALGVVLYECVTGEKPPEVLERMHGGAGHALAEGEWPGYSKRFLTAVDAAMAVKPADRPQSIGDWLAMLDGTAEMPGVPEPDEDVTRVVPFDTASDDIVPIAPPAAGFVPPKPIDTGVPETPSKAEFKRAGQTKTGKKTEEKVEPAPAATPPPAAPAESAPAAAAEPAEPAKPLNRKPDLAKPAKQDDNAGKRKLSKPLIAGGAVVALVAAAGIGWAVMDRAPTAPSEPVDVPAAVVAPPIVVPLADLTAGLTALTTEAKAANIPVTATEPLTMLGEELGKAPTDDLPALGERTRLAHGNFATALLRDAEARSGRIAREAPWANPAVPDAAAQEPAERQAVATNLRTGLEGLRAAVAKTTAAPDATQSLGAARETIGQYRAFALAATGIANMVGGDRAKLADLAKAKKDAARAAALSSAPTLSAAPVAAQTTAAATPTASSDNALSSATTSQFNGLVNEARGMARDVIRMGDRARPGSSPADKEAYDLLKANAQLARTYDSSLASLKDSFRGVRSDKQAEPLIKQARQTRAYLVFLVKRSNDASR